MSRQSQRMIGFETCCGCAARQRWERGAVWTQGELSGAKAGQPAGRRVTPGLRGCLAKALFLDWLSPGSGPGPGYDRLGRTDRKFKRLRTPKAASGQEVSEGQRAGQGGTASGADISGVLERAWAGRWGRVQARRAGVRSGAAAPCVAGDGGYPETRWSNAKPGSSWAMRSQCGVGSGSSSQPGGPRAGAIGGGRGVSPIWLRICSMGAASVINAALVFASTGSGTACCPSGRFWSATE